MTEDATRIRTWLRGRRVRRAPGRSVPVVTLLHLWLAYLQPEERQDWCRTRFCNAVSEFAVIGKDSTGRLAVANISLDRPPELRRNAQGRLERVFGR